MSETVKVTAKTTAKKSAAKRTNVVSLTRSRESPKTVNSPPDQTLNLQKTVGNQAMLRFAQSCPLTLPSPSLCPTGGVCHTCPVRVQPKLTIGKPGDKYEQEADRVAEQVMSIPEPRIRRQVEPEEEEEPIQTKLTNDTQVQRQAEEPEEEEEEPVQAKQASGQTPLIGPNLQSRINSLKGGGQPLPESTRKYFEPRFGSSFNNVRIHNNSQAANIAKSINAKAFTTGKDIVFGGGQYSPETSGGKRLLAHELTHILQQSGHMPDISSHKITNTTFTSENSHHSERVKIKYRLNRNFESILYSKVDTPKLQCQRLTKVERENLQTLRRNFMDTPNRVLREVRLKLKGVSMRGVKIFIVGQITANALRGVDIFYKYFGRRIGITRRDYNIVKKRIWRIYNLYTQPRRTPRRTRRTRDRTYGGGEKWEQVKAVGPIDAARAWLDSQVALRDAPATKLPGPKNGPQDAWRHCYWSCLMTDSIGKNQAKKVGDLHEKLGTNPKNQQMMDLHNNAAGRSCGEPRSKCWKCCMSKLNTGNLRIIPDWKQKAKAQPVKSTKVAPQKVGGYIGPRYGGYYYP